MKNIVFIAKTNINTDGRILNQLKILKEWNPAIEIDLVVFPDKKVTISFDESIQLHQIHNRLRNNKFLRIFTVVEFTFRAYRLLYKLKPNIIHAQDSSIIPPVLLYRILHPKKFYLIYDDHEVPNEKQSFLSKILTGFENIFIKNADAVISANKERMLYLKEKLKLKNTHCYFLNLPYYDVSASTVSATLIEKKLDDLDASIEKGTKFIIHQGPIKIERGRQKLANFSKNLPHPYEILLLGGSEVDFIKFKKENELPDEKFFFIGSVDYEVLPLFWKKGVASIVMYLPTYTNNRLCAPNRMYLSYFLSLPIIVNEDNPVLKDFISSHNAGVFIEDFCEDSRKDFFKRLDNLKIEDSAKEDLLKKEKNKINELYSNISV